MEGIMKLLFDIGCNVGDWIDANYSEDTIIIGVEASPPIFKQCQERFAGNENIRILNYLVSDKPGEERKTGSLFICEAISGVLSTASNDWMTKGRFANLYKWDNPVEVPTITLDSLITMFGIPDEIKIDVEGLEYLVLRGLSQKVPLIGFEWVEEDTNTILLSVLRLIRLGYEKFCLTDLDDYTKRPAEYYDFNTFMIEKLKLIPERASRWGMLYAKI
jgi:FkbM family methyltransferase